MGAEPVNSDNIFLYHKTTNRNVYVKARSSCSHQRHGRQVVCAAGDLRASSRDIPQFFNQAGEKRRENHNSRNAGRVREIIFSELSTIMARGRDYGVRKIEHWSKLLWLTMPLATDSGLLRICNTKSPKIGVTLKNHLNGSCRQYL